MRARIVLIGIVVTTAVVLFIVYQTPPSSKVSSSLPTNTDTKPYLALSPSEKQQYEAAIGQGLSYLQANEASVSPLQGLLLNYLQRKFDLNTKFMEFGASNASATATLSQVDATDLKIHSRIAKPNDLPSSLPIQNAEPINLMMMYATHCDHLALPSNYNELVQQNIAAGGYSLTHAGYSLERMKENSCSFDTETDQTMRRSIESGMVLIVNNEDTSTDLRYEAIALLQHMGRPDLVKKSWFDTIIAEQKSDGGWSVASDQAASSDHASVLALWALLEVTRQDSAYEPVLRRPNL